MATSVGSIKVDATLDSAKFEKSLSGMTKAANNAINNMIKSMQSSQATFTGIGNSIKTNIGNAVSQAAKTIRSLPSTTANAVKSLPSTVASAVKSIPNSLASAVSSVGRTLNQLPGMATRAMGSIASSAKDAASKVTKHFADAGQKVGESLKSAAKVGGVALAGLTTGVATSAVKGYASYEQNVGGVEKLFGDASGTVIANADKAFQTAGLSANQYMEAVTGFSASLINGLGGSTAEAANVADKAMQDMSDNANTFGTSMDSIMYTYQGFAKQNYTMLDNLKLGYGGTASEMARLINDSGVLGDTMEVTAENVNSVSFDKIIEAIHVTQERMNIAGTTSREASTTIEGSINSMKGAWENLTTTMASGSGIDKAMEDFVGTAEQALENLGPVLSNAMGQMARVLPELLPKLVTALSNLVTQLIPYISQLIIGLAQQLPGMLMTIVNAITNPVVIDAILNAGLALLDALISTFSNPEMLQKVVQASIQLLMGIINALPTIVDAFVEALPIVIDVLTEPETIAKMLEASVKLLMALVDAVPKILGALIDSFGTLVSNLWNGIKEFFSDIGGKIGDTVSGAIKGVINGALGLLEGFLNGPIDLINGALDLINKLPGVNVGKISRITLPRMATGGYVDGYGTSTSDSNMAMLSRGEYVVRADTVRKFGVGFMDALNEGRLPQAGASTNVQNYYYQFDQRANNRWMYQQIKTGAAA